MEIWLWYLLSEVDVFQETPNVVLEDNQGALVWSNEGVGHFKHLEIRRNFVTVNGSDEAIRLE